MHSASRWLSCRLATILLTCALPFSPLASSGVQFVSDAAAQTAKKAPAKKATAKSRRAAQVRAANARAARELATPRFKTAPDGSLVPDVRAAAAIIYDPETGEVLWEENSQGQRSIASITKLMTAVVFLENPPPFDDVVTIAASDVRAASTTYLRAREQVSVENLLHLLLIASDNAAARALARTSALGSKGFIDRMNEKAVELGLESTQFADPSGLDANNVSSAYDISRLITFAAADERLAPIMQKPDYTVKTNRRTVKIRNTNKLLGGEIEFRGAKTGFIRKAGYCFATLMQMPAGRQVAVVVLGATSSAARFLETKHLFNWLSDKAKDLLAPQPALTAMQP